MGTGFRKFHRHKDCEKHKRKRGICYWKIGIRNSRWGSTVFPLNKRKNPEERGKKKERKRKKKEKKRKSEKEKRRKGEVKKERKMKKERREKRKKER